MQIAGLQKLSLIDYPGKVAAVVFTQGCNFRCPYCHNPELIAAKSRDGMPEEEVLKHLQAYRSMLEGVCITGGEPTLQWDLADFIKNIKKLELKIKLDTNGTNPGMLERLLAEGLLNYIAMDLKHAWGKYDTVANTHNATTLENCKKTFGLIQHSGIDHEFRTTVFPSSHAEEDFMEIAGYLKTGEKYFVQNIRYEKTLDPNVDKSKTFDVTGIVMRLQAAYPRVIIGAR